QRIGRRVWNVGGSLTRKNQRAGKSADAQDGVDGFVCARAILAPFGELTPQMGVSRRGHPGE
ncbi:MAG TPA: hypothetical protein VGF45_01780, partial [Polyangia bacterium]